jgi:beta-lactamase class A
MEIAMKKSFIIYQILLIVVLSVSSDAIAATKMSSVQQQLSEFEATSDGRLGISAIDTSNNRQIQYRGNESFPMGCTSKVIGVAAILKESMKNNRLLQEKIHYTKSDLTNWTPITEKHLAEGMTVEALSAAAISYSDNTAMNLLSNNLGGPKGINAFARSLDDHHFKLDHGWPDEARSSPASLQDSTTPAAMTTTLRKIALGDVLAPLQREKLLAWLKENVTGDARIRAGVPKGWMVGDKTGSGFHYGTTNDIAVIWPPKCTPIIITTYYSSDKKDSPKREEILAQATRILIHAFSETNSCIRNAVTKIG